MSKIAEIIDAVKEMSVLELAELVKVENYEKAAQVRDAIRELEMTSAPEKKSSPETEA